MAELEWVSSGGLPPELEEWPTWTDVSRDPMQGPLRRMPWRAPIWDGGASGSKFMPGLMRKHTAFWDDVVLPGHHLREALESYVRDGVSVHKFLVKSHKGTSVDSPYNGDKFPGAVLANLIPPAHAASVKAEVRALIARGCLVKWTNVRAPAGRERPRMIQAFSVEETKLRLIYDARASNKACKRTPLSMDTVGRVSQVSSEGCFQSSLDNSLDGYSGCGTRT